MRVVGGNVLRGASFVRDDVAIDEATCLLATAATGRDLDARGLYVLPGIVDIHGDAFERQIMPRPGVAFPIDVALRESDRQCVSNGITTVFHGVTCSWEPGLRGLDNAQRTLEAIETHRHHFNADTRFHLRFETYNLDALNAVHGWLEGDRVDLLAFNDHLPGPDTPPRTRKIGQMAERAGVPVEDFQALIERLGARAEEVPNAITSLARAAKQFGVPTLSHDDVSPDQRRWYRDLDCRLAEFPTTVDTARSAIAAGDDVVLGAPNVVRGGSHVGWIGAADMVAKGCCTILASDYYYPAPLLAAFRLASDRIAPLADAWALVSERPARAAGLRDRGTLEPGHRADILLVDGEDLLRPRLIASICNGRIAYLTEPDRLR